MSYTIPTIEPKKFTAGDTVKWTKSFPDFPASDGWVLSYAFVNADGAFGETTSEADGDGFLVTISASESGAITAGEYTWQAYVTLDTERFQVGRGLVVVAANFADGAVDGRSDTKVILDALTALMKGTATSEQASVSINGRSISKYTLGERIQLIEFYKREYAREQREEAIESGLGHRGKVRIRFLD